MYRNADITRIACAGVAALLFSATGPAWADDAAAQALIKKSACGTCHAVDKAKEGPSYKETAAKYKGKADAEDTLYKHQVAHKKVKSTNEAEIRNLVKYILAQ